MSCTEPYDYIVMHMLYTRVYNDVPGIAADPHQVRLVGRWHVHRSANNKNVIFKKIWYVYIENSYIVT